MPFFEIFDFHGTRAQRKAANELMTKALCDAYEITPNTISAYFIDVGAESYGHEGRFSEDATQRRIFLKVHAFRRPDQLRRIAARTLTQALAAAYEMPEKDMAVYFFDLDPDQVSHNGVLASD